MVSKIMTVVRRLPVASGSAALMLCLALSGGCASGSSQSTARAATGKQAYDAYDRNGDNGVTPEEWDLAYQVMDANGDGIVTYDEYRAATLAAQH